MLFFGGIGTSVLAFELTEFARSLRERLGLRVISVQRDHFGPVDEAVDDVLLVLELLGIDRAAVVAISGGGPHAAAFAARAPDRLISLHLAAAVACGPIARIAADPIAMWRFPTDSPVHRIPGFDRTAAREGARGGGAEAIEHQWQLLANAKLPALEHVFAPTYLYWGTGDDVVPPEHADAWQAALTGSPITLRLYDGEAHDVQYRHWDQILLDAAGSEDRPAAAP